MAKILKHIGTHLLFSSIPCAFIWVLTYVIASFTKWELYNPLQWVIDIPTYEPEARFFIIFFYLFYQAICIGATITYFKGKAKLTANQNTERI